MVARHEEGTTSTEETEAEECDDANCMHGADPSFSRCLAKRLERRRTSSGWLQPPERIGDSSIIGITWAKRKGSRAGRPWYNRRYGWSRPTSGAIAKR